MIDPNTLTKLVAAWRAAGLPPDPLEEIAGQAAATLDRLSRDHRAAVDNRSDVRRTIVEQVVAGDLDFAAAAYAELSAAASGPDQKARISALYRSAVNVVCDQAHRDLRAIGEAFITDHLAPAHDRLVEIVIKHAPAIADVRDDQTAVKAGPKVREAWGKVTDAVAVRAQLKKALGELSQGRIVAPLSTVHHHDFRFFSNPEVVPFGVARMHPVVQLVALIDAGTGPGIYTAEQALEHFHQWDQADRASALGGDAA